MVCEAMLQRKSFLRSPGFFLLLSYRDRHLLPKALQFSRSGLPLRRSFFQVTKKIKALCMACKGLEDLAACSFTAFEDMGPSVILKELYVKHFLISILSLKCVRVAEILGFSLEIPETPHPDVVFSVLQFHILWRFQMWFYRNSYSKILSEH